MFSSRTATVLIRPLVRSIRNIPGAILRLLRAILLQMVLHGRGMVWKIVPLRPNSRAASPTSSCMGGEGVRDPTVVPSLAPASCSLTHLLPEGPHGDSADNSSPSMPGAVDAPDIDVPLPTLPVTPVITLDPKPTAPEYILRSRRRKPVKRGPNKESINLGTIDYSESTPGTWKRAVHPNGGHYFFDPNKQVFTDIDLVRQRNLDEIDQYIDFLREKESRLVPGPAFQKTRTQLVIQLDQKEGRREWLYYFVNHDTRVVFWVDELQTKNLSAFKHLQGITALSHIGYEIESQYWFHCKQYPNCSTVSQDHVTGFYGILAHACADHSTSALSTFSESQLLKLLKLAPYLQSRVGVTDEYALWVIARVMGPSAHARFSNFHGQPGARFEANVPVYTRGDDEDQNTFLFQLVEILSWNISSSYIEELKGIWVDKKLNYTRWVDFSNRRNSELSGFAIYSTVMLAADIGFFAVPGVYNNGSPTFAAALNFCSLLFIVASLLSSALLARERYTQGDSVARATSFMHRMTRWRGLQPLGIMYSLPFSLLIWAMIWFVTALCVVVLGSPSGNNFTKILTGVYVISVGSLVSLPIWWGRVDCCCCGRRARKRSSDV